MNREERVSKLSGRQAKRTLHVIDLENLVWGRADKRRLVIAALAQYQAKVLLDASRDMFIVGVKADFHHPVSDIRAAAPGPDGRGCEFDFTIVYGHNTTDGADDALLTAVELLRSRTPPLRDDFRQVAYASADKKFIKQAVELKSEALQILQVIGLNTDRPAWEATLSAPFAGLGKDALKKVFFEELPNHWRRRGGNQKGT